MNQEIKFNELPIVEDDIIFEFDENNKKIKMATTLMGEINHLLSPALTKEGEIFVMWHSDFNKQCISKKEINVLENRCEVGMGISSLIEQEKYGICVKKKVKASCVVLDNKEVKYLLNVDADRLQSFSDINYDLCFYKNSIYEVSDINYTINLNFKNQLNIEISTTKRNFVKRFLVIGDSFNKNFSIDKAHELDFVSNKSPMSFNEIIGKVVSIKSSELLKFKNNLELKELIGLIDESKDEKQITKDKIDQGDKREEFNNKKQNETITIGDLFDDENNTNKENKPIKINERFVPDQNSTKSMFDRNKMVNFTVLDVAIYEVIMNCIKDFTGSNNDQDFKTEKIRAGEQLDKVKFFKINDKQVQLGSRWKLDLTEQDEFVNFEEYQNYVDTNVKEKIIKLPKQSNKFNINDYKVEVNKCYENVPVRSHDALTQVILPQSESHYVDNEAKSSCIKSLSKSDNSFIIIDSMDDDDVFFDDCQSIDKQLSKEELKNQNLRMLARLNRRSRNPSSRTNSLTTRAKNERLMNNSFKNVILGSSNEDNEDKDRTTIKMNVKSDKSMKKTVLVDVLYVDTFVDVHWQDNTIETNIPLSHVSEEIDNLIQKYYPGNFVDFTGEINEKFVPTYGVIQKVNQSSNIAQVKWFNEDSDSINQSNEWITNESLFNLRSSCIHFHLNDVVVGSELITNFTKTSIEEIPRLIGTVKQISTEGQGLIAWIDGTEAWKKLVELVSFFDVDFSDFSEDDESISSLDSKENSDLSHDWDNENELIVLKFTDEHKFNKHKFECINDDLNTTIDENRLKNKWLKKIESLFKLVEEFKAIQVDRLNKQALYRLKNHTEDKKIVDLTFEIIKCYYDKIRYSITTFTMQSKEDKNFFSDFYLQLVFSLNNWLDVIQSNYYYLFLLFEENAFKNLTNACKPSSKNSTVDEQELSLTLIDDLKGDDKDETIIRKQMTNEYKQKMINLINDFNNEVAKRVDLINQEMDFDKSDLNSNANTSFTVISSTISSNDNNTSQNNLTIFKRLDCISLENNNIKHEFIKKSLNSVAKKVSKINFSTLQKELNILRQNLPDSGIYFRTFEERLDLFSLMIEGSKDTVYENHLFLFDLKINENMQEPPECAYLSFGRKQINPNLYTDGNVCLSLLNTFFSKLQTERWQANKSSLLQLAISLQALVLNSNPFYNEADFDSYYGTLEGRKKSKLYNEFVIINLIDYSIDLMRKRNDSVFKNEITKFYQSNAYTICKRYFDYIYVSLKWNLKIKDNEKLNDEEIEKKFNEMIKQEYSTFETPTFLLLPASVGFCLTLAKNLKLFISFFKEHLPATQIDAQKKQIEDLISTVKV